MGPLDFCWNTAKSTAHNFWALPSRCGFSFSRCVSSKQTATAQKYVFLSNAERETTDKTWKSNASCALKNSTFGDCILHSFLLLGFANVFGFEKSYRLHPKQRWQLTAGAWLHIKDVVCIGLAIRPPFRQGLTTSQKSQCAAVAVANILQSESEPEPEPEPTAGNSF